MKKDDPEPPAPRLGLFDLGVFWGELPSFNEIAQDIAQGIDAPLLEITDLETKLDGLSERGDLGLEALLVEINLDAMLAMEALWGKDAH